MAYDAGSKRMSYKPVLGGPPVDPIRSRGQRGADKVSRITKRSNTERAAASEGITPLEYMLKVMRDDTAALSRRDDMAKSAAPYMHPRLQTVTGPNGSGLFDGIIFNVIYEKKPE